MESLNINGKILRVSIQRKPIRNLILRLKSPDELLISAPYACSNAEIQRFVEAKRSWIEAHTEKLARRQAQQSRPASGKIAVYGKPVELQWVIGKGKARLQPDRLILYGADACPETKQRAFDQFAKSSLEAEVERLRPKWDQVIADYHLAAPTIHYRRMTSRWGSCIPAKSKITLNLNLIHYPLACVNSVLWHEYAHLIVPNHSQRFYTVIRHHMPDYDTRKALLNGDL